jgi:hypothetical protein
MPTNVSDKIYTTELYMPRYANIYIRITYFIYQRFGLKACQTQAVMVRLSCLFRIKLHGIWFKTSSKWISSHACFNSMQRISESQLNLNHGTCALLSVDFASLRTWLPFVATPTLKFRLSPCKDKRYSHTFECASSKLMQ